MVNTTVWRPDTCGCEIHYTWDTEATPRVHTLAKSVPCAIHVALGFLPDKQAHFDAIQDENRRKNRVFAILAELPAWPKVDGQPDSGPYAWGFDGTRVLHISLIGITLSPGAKTTLLTKLAAEFGVKVSLE